MEAGAFVGIKSSMNVRDSHALATFFDLQKFETISQAKALVRGVRSPNQG
jgi:hypothetical protein